MKARTPSASLNRRSRRAAKSAARGDEALDRAVPGFDRKEFLARFWAMDATLVAAGFPGISEWWREAIERFIRSGCRRWIIRAGRRAGKSTTLCRLAVAWAWFGPWSVPRGDVPVVAFVSVSRDEAVARLKTIAELHSALGFEVERREGELVGVRGVAFRVYAATTTAVVGFTSVLVVGDEVARWESRDTAANPAQEVFGSLMPTMATQPHGFAVLCSSPWSTEDYHAESFDKGDSAHQLTSYAPTWIANPTITEEQTHALEPDERAWSREYAAVPGTTITQAVDRADAIACFSREPAGKPAAGFLAIDASSLRGDDFAYLAGFVTDLGEYVVGEVDGWGPEDLRGETMRAITNALAERAAAWGATEILGDQREEASLRALLADYELGLVSYAWTDQSKDRAVQALRALMREGRLCLPDHSRLRKELVGLKAALAPSGRIKYATNGRDYVSALITLMHGVVTGRVAHGPIDTRLVAAGSGRTDLGEGEIWTSGEGMRVVRRDGLRLTFAFD